VGYRLFIVMKLKIFSVPVYFPCLFREDDYDRITYTQTHTHTHSLPHSLTHSLTHSSKFSITTFSYY